MYRDTIQLLAASLSSAAMSDADFVRIQREYPALLSLVTSARKEGDLTNAIFDVHFPTTLSVREQNVEEATQKTLQKLTELARWLLVASTYFGFNIFGGNFFPGKATSKPTKPARPSRKHKSGKRMVFHNLVGQVDKKLRKKLHIGLRRFVMENAKSNRQGEVRQLIKQQTGVTLTTGSMSRLYKRLGLR